MKFLLATIGLVMQGSTGMAQSCDSYIGQSISPLTVSQASARVPNFQPKGEFETTADFEARKKVATSASESPLFISREPEDRKYFEYNADAQALGIKKYVFSNWLFEAWDAFYGVPSAKPLNANVYATANLSPLTSSKEIITGSYEAQNSFGAKFNVTKVTKELEAIFERSVETRPGGPLGMEVFPAADEAPYIIGYLNLSPAEAQRLKPLLKLAYVVEPKEPYIIKNTYSLGKTTLANPIETTAKATVLIADIKCGLVTDDKNVVLGAYPTR
jgi:hypothetical protein